MKKSSTKLVIVLFCLLGSLRVMHAAEGLPNDVRLQPLKTLDGYFPFTPPTSKEAWADRREYVRRQILVAEGLWPMPTKTALNPVIHGKIERPDYTVEKVYFESAPGFFVTGNLYRPVNAKGKVPAVMFAHGHWKDARLSVESPEAVKKLIASGQERFEQGGRSIFQSMCVQLARMGCIVWQWDMLSDSDSKQFTPQIIHKFAKQRPEMNTTENWGLYSTQAEAHCQSVMGLQTWNAVRSLDFLLTLPDVDPERVAITGASGGGTQTMLLSAIDDRIKLSFPAVMVSTAMQGGCTCESASLLRVNTGNIEFAGLFAPKPLGMTCANDWTKEMSTKGFPELQQLYAFLGAPKNVMLERGERFPHNYNSVSRAAFYNWLNLHFKLGAPEPVAERDYEVIPPAQLSVWDAEHPAPKANGPDFERALLKWFTEDAAKQLNATTANIDTFRRQIGLALDVLLGNRHLENMGETTWTQTKKLARGDHFEVHGLVRNTTYNEELPVTWLLPREWTGEVVVWLDSGGKASLLNADGVKPTVMQLVAAGTAVLGADLLFQGDFLADGKPLKQTRVVPNPREFAGYTFGYNDSLFAQRTHDILTLFAYARKAKVDETKTPTKVTFAGLGEAGPILAAARSMVGGDMRRAAIDTHGFRFGKLLDYRDPQFLPGGAKYLDLPGILALSAPNLLWLAGEGKEAPLVASAYRAYGMAGQLTLFDGDAAETEVELVKWLLR